jgi:hypothetical protein
VAGVLFLLFFAAAATTDVGLHNTALAYCATIAVLAAVAAGSLIFRGRLPPLGVRKVQSRFGYPAVDLRRKMATRQTKKGSPR